MVVRLVRAYLYYLARLLVIFVSANVHSGIGVNSNLEQVMSILPFCFGWRLYAKKVEFRLFSWFGLYSYEIILFHWPLMYRMILFMIYAGWLAWLSTILYLIYLWPWLVMGKIIIY